MKLYCVHFANAIPPRGSVFKQPNKQTQKPACLPLKPLILDSPSCQMVVLHSIRELLDPSLFADRVLVCLVAVNVFFWGTVNVEM